MPRFYQCIICHHANVSILDLHNHHIEQHNATELSQTIINLQGFRVYSAPRHVKQESPVPTNLNDNNNNDDSYNHDSYNRMFDKSKSKIKEASKSEQMTDSPRKLDHDEITCSINCSQFIAWEHELNKRTEINDEEFFDIIESFCCDLNKGRHKGKKKRHRTNLDEIDSKDIAQHLETNNIIEIKNTVVQLNTESIQAATTSFSNSQDATNMFINNEVVIAQVENEIEHTENIENKTIALTETTDCEDEKERDTVICNPLYKNFSWRSIIIKNIEQRDFCIEEDDIYTKSMEPTIENLLS